MRSAQLAAISQPAAGADWSWTPSGSDTIVVVSIIGKLATSATAGSRVPALQIIGQDGEVVYQTAPNVSQTVSLTDFWQWDASFHGASFSGLYTATASINTVAMPYIHLPPKWKIQSKTLLLDTTDQWSALFALYYDRWQLSDGQLAALEVMAENT